MKHTLFPLLCFFLFAGLQAAEQPVPTTIKEMKLILEDRVPLAKINDISIETNELSGAAYQEERGIVRWEIDLASGERMEKRLSYTLKYPSSRKIVLYE